MGWEARHGELGRRAVADERAVAGPAGRRSWPAPQTCLESTGLAEESLRDTGATVSARQELTVIANLLRALGDPPGLGLEVGSAIT
jgi:hypothetical protein